MSERILNPFVLFREMMAGLPDWLKLTDLADVLRFLASLFPLPAWSDVAATRRWLLASFDQAEELTDKTSTKIDDVILGGLRVIAENEKAWASIHSLLIDMFGDTEALPVATTDPRVAKVADEVEIDPATIILIINAILELLKWWQDRDATS